MPVEWTDSLERVNWDELAALYRAAPLGDKGAADLELVFSSSMFRCFAFDSGSVVGAGRVWQTAVTVPTCVMWQCCQVTRVEASEKRSFRGFSTCRNLTTKFFFTRFPARSLSIENSVSSA